MFFNVLMTMISLSLQAIKALLEVVQLGGKNLEIAVMSRDANKKTVMKMLPLEEIESFVAEIEEEKEKEAAANRRDRSDAAEQP